MKSCTICGEHQADAVYGQLSASTLIQYRQHLAQNPSCAAEFEDLQVMVASLKTTGDEAETDPLAGFWDRLEPQLKSVKQHQRGEQPWRKLLLTAAAIFVASLGLWYGAGREQPLQTAKNPELLAVSRYMDKAQPLLLAVANHRNGKTTATGFDHQTERDHATLLAQEAAQIRSSLNRTGSAKRLLGDIELLLLQIANLDDSHYGKDIALVQDYMQQRTILLKVSLMEMKQNTT